jgi:hypothetical protein
MNADLEEPLEMTHSRVRIEEISKTVSSELPVLITTRRHAIPIELVGGHEKLAKMAGPVCAIEEAHRLKMARDVGKANLRSVLSANSVGIPWMLRR